MAANGESDSRASYTSEAMPPRFDGETLTLELAVADLLETSLLRSLGFANRGGYERMWLGPAHPPPPPGEAPGDDGPQRRGGGRRTPFQPRGRPGQGRGRVHAPRRAAGGLVFPYQEIRPGQELIQAAVETAVANREHLLLQATTGIGKTVAALYPALRYCLAHDKRLFVLTAKTLQQEMATAVLLLLNQDAAFRSLRLRAKAKMCANDQVICHEEYCRFAKDYALKLQTSGVLAEIYGRFPAIEPDDVFRAARAAEVCPFEVSLELASRVEVTVCDYNYAFDPYVSLPDFSPDQDLSDAVLVIDEVHNLVERGRGYYSPELSAAAARLAAAAIGRLGEPIHLRIAALCLKLAAIVEDTVHDCLDDLAGGSAGSGAGAAGLEASGEDGGYGQGTDPPVGGAVAQERVS